MSLCETCMHVCVCMHGEKARARASECVCVCERERGGGNDHSAVAYFFISIEDGCVYYCVRLFVCMRTEVYVCMYI